MIDVSQNAMSADVSITLVYTIYYLRINLIQMRKNKKELYFPVKCY